MTDAELSRVGLWTATFDSTSVSELAVIATELDRQGWPSLWFAEAFGREALSTAAILLARSEHIRVGTGIASVYGRDAMAAAAAARTLEALHPGRFTLGLGVSHGPLVEGLRGHDYGRPLATMSTYVNAIHAAPALVPGEHDLPSIVVAALGPKMLELAAARAGGAMTYLVGPEHTRAARSVMGERARLVVEQAVVVSPDISTDEWRRRAREHLAVYTELPNYRSSFTRQGFSEHDLADGGSESLRMAMVPFGIAAALERVTEHIRAGADEVLLQVLGDSSTAPPRADWALLADLLHTSAPNR
jgi:probable F420-dependent oxidoreductase